MKKFLCIIIHLTYLISYLSSIGSENDPQKTIEIRVMSFNIWVDGKAGKQPLHQTAKAITEAKADIVGLQEARNNAGKIAALVGMNHIQQIGGNAIISKFKIKGLTKNRIGAIIEVSPGNDILLYNNHFSAAPYQPYQLLKIPYGSGRFIETEAEAIEEANKARGNQVARLLEEIEDNQNLELPTFITGDFNEPSHLDWTEATAKIKRHPLKVEYPASKRIADAGFLDAFRILHPNEVEYPGMTWTPITKPDNPKDHHDRIDFVLYGKREAIIPMKAEIVGESPEYADITVSPYPSDHRGVVVTFNVNF